MIEMNGPEKPVIIDTDPGVDDALALILALRSPELHVKAITTVNGNTSLRQSTENALRILEIVALPDPPPVIPGAAIPLNREPIPSASIHGRDGLGEITFLKDRRGKKKYTPPRHKPEPTYAPGAIIELVNEHPGEITIITLGPLTNIALALQTDPGLSRHVKEIITMGGAYSVPGNVTPAAEFNFYCDPEAAQEVIGSGIPLTLVGLDVTRSARLSRHALMNATKKRTRLNQFLRDSTEFVMDFYREREGYHGCCVHDALAVMAAIDGSIIGTKRAHVEIETEGKLTAGMSVADLRPYARGKTGAPNATIALYVDSTRFEQQLLERITDA
ncbi:MAG: nucleoside hydrolase [Candidatus Abyssobacteria bacterium SURF_17]|jgi:purine nucleosidase/pyrimidine-specific ribonucleoside hydrolase|uniref:Nucleoside hydrolase n=1 Tax=Candidatus Abyssobacteria bacterium SURF_17 TaxID=2093361 RepID=A0A419EWV3_9BACT|nr:MAG: nucleoside hydrolase [Candidatus Abyssubacteria bacterium SURF_17]